MSAAMAVLVVLVAPALVGTASAPRTPAVVRWTFGAVSLCLVAVVLHGLGAPRETARVALVALTVAAAATCGARRGSTRVGHADPVLASALALIALAGMILVLAAPVQAWDGVAIWYRKTRALLDWDPLAALPFPAYPDLGPMGWSLLLAIAGTAAEPVGRLLFLGLYVAWLGSLALWVPSPSRVRFLLILAAGASLDLDASTNGYQDAVVMSVAGTSAVLLGRLLLDGGAGPPRAREDERRHVALGLFLAGALGLVKAEGAILGAILVGAWSIAVAITHGPRRLKSSLPFVGLWLGLTALWPLLLLSNGVGLSTFQQGGYALPSPSEAVARLSRLPTIVYGFARLGPWHVLPIVAALLTSGAAWRRDRAVRPVLAWLWGSAIAHWACIVGIFLLTDFDLAWHLRTALDRLELQHGFVWPAATIVGTAAVLRTSARSPRVAVPDARHG